METDSQHNPLNQIKNQPEGKHNESLAEQITDIFPALIYVYNIQEREISYMNTRISDFLGYSLEDVDTWNNDLMQMVCKEDQEKVGKELELCFTIIRTDLII